VKKFFNKKDVEEYTQMLAAEALVKVKGIVEEAGVPYQVKVRIGLPKVEICQEAEEAKAGLIVMGYRGLGAVAGVVMGSVSYGVLHDAPCPVTIVR
jgi:nucleotide-binding universal stress UspA family protein